MPNAKAQNGRTPLHLAVEQGQEDLVALLLNNKADPNALDSEGRTPLDLTKPQAAHDLWDSAAGFRSRFRPSNASGSSNVPPCRKSRNCSGSGVRWTRSRAWIRSN